MCVLYLQVTLCSNTVRRYRQALVVDVQGVGKEIMALPINARSDTQTDENIHANTLSYANTLTPTLAEVRLVLFDSQHMKFIKTDYWVSFVVVEGGFIKN